MVPHLVVRCCSLQLENSVICSLLVVRGVQVTIFCQPLQNILLVDIRLWQVFNLLTSCTISDLDWQVVVQVQQADLQKRSEVS